MTNDCKTCPVSTGTHKPTEAVHQIAEPQADALRLADDCEESATHWVHEIDTRAKAAKLLRAQHARIAELESQLEAIGAGGVEPLRKGFVRLTDVLARLEQGFGANSAPVTTIKRHFEMQAVPAPDERAAFEAWLGIKPCGAAHDFGWAAWQARAALAATQPAAQGMEQDAARWRMVALISRETMIHPDKRTATEAVAAYMHAVHSGLDIQGAIDAALAAQAKQGGA